MTWVWACSRFIKSDGVELLLDNIHLTPASFFAYLLLLIPLPWKPHSPIIYYYYCPPVGWSDWRLWFVGSFRPQWCTYHIYYYRNPVIRSSSSGINFGMPSYLNHNNSWQVTYFEVSSSLNFKASTWPNSYSAECWD